MHSLPNARTLDVACETGFLTYVPGLVIGVDQSPAMVAIARSRLPSGLAVVGDGLHLAVSDGTFDRVLTSHFYGHLPLGERETFLSKVSRVATELVVVDSARRPGVGAQEWQERVLNDGSHGITAVGEPGHGPRSWQRRPRYRVWRSAAATGGFGDRSWPSAGAG